MDKHEIIKKAILIPVIVGIILSIVLFLFIRYNTNLLLPIQQGTILAYHDNLESEQANLSRESDETNSLSTGETIGNLSINGTSLAIYYDGDYSSLSEGLIYKTNSNNFGEVGTVYLNTASANANEIGKSISIESIYGNFNYSLIDERSAKNEYEILTYAPAVKNSLVIYYQQSDGHGLLNKYKALVFEEVN